MPADPIPKPEREIEIRKLNETWGCVLGKDEALRDALALLDASRAETAAWREGKHRSDEDFTHANSVRVSAERERDEARASLASLRAAAAESTRRYFRGGENAAPMVPLTRALTGTLIVGEIPEVALARAEMLRESADMLDVLADEGCLEASLRCEARLARELAADIESKVAAAKGSEPR